MKNTLASRPSLFAAIAVAALLAAPVLHAQTDGPLTWAQSYGVASYDGAGAPSTDYYYGSGSDVPAGIAAMPDGGFVVAGGLDLPELYQSGDGHNGHSCAALVRYGADGQVLWQQVLRQDNDEIDHAIQRSRVSQLLGDGQGNLYARIVKEGTGGGPVIAKFAPDGSLLWQSAFTGDAYQYGDPPKTDNGYPYPFTSMSVTTDGGVVFCGSEDGRNSTNGGNGFSRPFFAKFNADGTLGIHRPFDNSGQYDSATAATQSADGTNFLVAMHAVVVLTDAAGGKLAERTFANALPPYSSSSGESVVHALANADGTYTLLSIASNQYYTAYIVRKLHADLTPVWEKVIYNVSPTGTLSHASDGGYLLTSLGSKRELGGVFGDSTDADAVVLRLNADGNLVSSFLLGSPATEGPTGTLGSQGSVPSVVETTDGGYGVTVSTYGYKNDPADHPDWWVVKCDKQGRVQNFHDNAAVVPVTAFTAQDNTAASIPSAVYGGTPSNYTGNAGYLYNAPANFVVQNLGAKEGINHPTVLIQAAPAVVSAHVAFFAGETALNNGVFYLQFASGNPFGYYSFLSDTHYIYHFDLGYEYVFDAADGKSGVYLYDFKSNTFFYTSPAFPFPYLYDFTLNSVVYYYPDPNNAGRYNTNGIRYFYVFNTGQIITK